MRMLIALLFLCSASAQVPNTTTFDLTDVVQVVGNSNSLNDAFLSSNPCAFDPRYEATGQRQSEFRNYGYMRVKLDDVFFCSIILAQPIANQFDLVVTTNSTNWIIGELEDWIVLSGYGPYSGNQTITVTVSANVGPYRDANITSEDLSGNGFENTFFVAQTAGN